MSHLPFTLLAYLFNATSVLVDKFLLTKSIKDPLIYVFYFSCFSLLVLVVIPFTHIPNWQVLSLASLSTILWTTGAYFMIRALMRGHAARVIPIIGTLIPLITLGINQITGNQVNTNQIWAVWILVMGLAFLTLPAWKGKVDKWELIYEGLASMLFAVSYVILHQAYLMDDFLTVFVWSRMVLIPVGALILLIPYSRHIVLAKDHESFKLNSKYGGIFLLGQLAGGASELLITFSVSLANPAIVSALQGSQYIFLIVASWILAKRWPKIYHEPSGWLGMAGKLIGILLVGFGLYILAIAVPTKQLELGVTFSERYARELGVDPKVVFEKSLSELNIKRIKLPVYWDETELEPGQYDFTKTDGYLEMAKPYQTEILLSVGYKQPRWPECFAPEWTTKLTDEQFQQKIVEFVTATVKHYQSYEQIKYWQIENEPLLAWGDCPKMARLTPELLAKEVAAVRAIDQRPIVLTDSGELRSWVDAMKPSDIFGFSLYRTVHNPIFGLVDYPLPPIYYQLKATISKIILGKSSNVWITELQTEPWSVTGAPLPEVELSEQRRVFPVNRMNEHVNFARETGFDRAYLWGVEWWYYMVQQNDSSYWQSAKQIFSEETKNH